MLKALLKSTLILASLALPAYANSDLKKTTVALQKAAFVMVNYSANIADRETLAKGEKVIETAWRDLVKELGVKHAFAKSLAFIRARSVTAAKHKRKIIPAWQDALKQIPGNMPKVRKANLYTEAGNAAAFAGNYRLAEQYFAYARSLAVDVSSDKERAQLYMRLNELKTTGKGMEWRPLRDSLSDLRKVSEHFTLWSVPRLDALLGETEIRVAYQPESPEKRTDLAELKAKIILVQKNLDEKMPAMHLQRLRSVMYVLEDYWDL